MTTSLLISTYNWPGALQLCLHSIMRQSTLPDEVIICDDGSGKETTDVVKKFQESSPIPIEHVWQEDEGFRLSAVRNKGFAIAKGDFLIQIDGDLILHRHFVRDHKRFAREGYFTTGSRVLLSAETSARLLHEDSIDAMSDVRRHNNILNSLHFPFLHEFMARRYKSTGKNTYYVKGCNMAFFKKDIIRVNGYNENFTGWGREDSEIAIRLINSGIKKRFLKFGGICYHIFHKEVSREMEAKNTQMMTEAIEKKVTRAENGLDKYK